jgi:hypothetical protein
MNISHAKMHRWNYIMVLLLGVGAICLMIHFGICYQTSASAFINRPEFYYNRFVIRDSSGQSIGNVSLAAGFWSYVTAFISAGTLCWGATLAVVMAKKRRKTRQGAA